MRKVTVFLFMVAFVAVSRGADVSVVRVWPEWRDADSFDRISEYFTHRENTGAEIVRRTQPSVREGFYFLTRLRNEGPEQPFAKVVLSIIDPTSPKSHQVTFDTGLPRGETVFELGLTGTDWPGRKTHPVAWKIEVVGRDGAVLATEKSFLWEKPAK